MIKAGQLFLPRAPRVLLSQRYQLGKKKLFTLGSKHVYYPSPKPNLHGAVAIIDNLISWKLLNKSVNTASDRQLLSTRAPGRQLSRELRQLCPSNPSWQSTGCKH